MRAPYRWWLLPPYVTAHVAPGDSAPALDQLDEGLSDDVRVEMAARDVGMDSVGLQLAGVVAHGAVPVGDDRIRVVGHDGFERRVGLGDPVAATEKVDDDHQSLRAQGIEHAPDEFVVNAR